MWIESGLKLGSSTLRKHAANPDQFKPVCCVYNRAQDFFCIFCHIILSALEFHTTHTKYCSYYKLSQAAPMFIQLTIFTIKTSNNAQSLGLYYIGAPARAEMEDGHSIYFYMIELNTNSKIEANYNFWTNTTTK